MGYEKKVILIKGITNGYSLGSARVSAIARIEAECGVAKLYLSIINIKALRSGEYFVFIAFDGRKIFHSALSARPTTIAIDLPFCPDLEKGVAVGLVCVKNSIPETFAFGRCESSATDLVDFKKKVAETLLKNPPATLKKEQNTTADFTKTVNEYDDEAVATCNYFDLDDEIEQKLKIIEENVVSVRNEDAVPFNQGEKKENQAFKSVDGAKDEAGGNDSQSHSKKPTCYEQARTELENIFQKFPEDLSLKKIFPDCRFAKIHYSPEKYYVVGEVKENGKVKYICYGIPDTYKPQPPKELKGFCSFVPLSVFDLKGKGFWMMFQDAISGECVKKCEIDA